MSGCHGNMITAGGNVACLSKAGGRQKFSHRNVRELYNFSKVITTVDEQTGASRQYCVYGIFQAPIFMVFRYSSCVEIVCKQLSEFLDAKPTEGDYDELKHAMGEFPLCLFDFLQGALICFVESLWYFGQCFLKTCGWAATNVVHLTFRPLKPRLRK